MKALIGTACFLLLIVAFECCKKPKNNKSPVGGKGGNVTINVTPEHHGDLVDSCTIYIKYATSDAPSNGIYDDSAKCVLVDTTPVAKFTNLTTGSYYLYAYGYHATYSPPFLKGGLPFSVSTEGSQQVFLPTYSFQP